MSAADSAADAAPVAEVWLSVLMASAWRKRIAKQQHAALQVTDGEIAEYADAKENIFRRLLPLYAEPAGSLYSARVPPGRRRRQVRLASLPGASPDGGVDNVPTCPTVGEPPRTAKVSPRHRQ